MGAGERNARTASIPRKPGRRAGSSLAASLSGPAAPAVPDAAPEAAARHAAALSFQAQALARLIGDLLGAEARDRDGADAAFPELNLPGSNPDDALRYLLRGLRAEARAFDAALSKGAGDRGRIAPRLARLHQFALATVGALAAAPAGGAGAAILALIGGLLDRAALLPWRDFTALCERVPGAARALPEPPAAPSPEPVAAAPPRQSEGVANGRTPEADPDGTQSGAAAEDPLEIPLILVRPQQGDWARVLFKRGLAYLAKVTGEPADALEPLLGDWLAQTGEDAKKVFGLLAEAQSRREPDPKTWIRNALSADFAP